MGSTLLVVTYSYIVSQCTSFLTGITLAV